MGRSPPRGAPAMRQGKLLTQICGSNSVLAEIELAEGEQVGAQFTPPGEAVEAVPERTQPEPQKPRRVEDIAEQLEQAGVQPREATALAKLHNDVETILNSAMDSAHLGISLVAPIASTPAAETAIAATPVIAQGVTPGAEAPQQNPTTAAPK